MVNLAQLQSVQLYRRSEPTHVCWFSTFSDQAHQCSGFSARGERNSPMYQIGKPHCAGPPALCTSTSLLDLLWKLAFKCVEFYRRMRLTAQEVRIQQVSPYALTSPSKYYVSAHESLILHLSLFCPLTLQCWFVNVVEIEKISRRLLNFMHCETRK